MGSRLDELERENALLREANRRLQAQGEDLERYRLVQQLRAVIERQREALHCALEYLSVPWHKRISTKDGVRGFVEHALSFEPPPRRPSNELRALRRFYLDVRALCLVAEVGVGWIPEPARRRVQALILAAEAGGATATPPDAAP